MVQKGRIGGPAYKSTPPHTLRDQDVPDVTEWDMLIKGRNIHIFPGNPLRSSQAFGHNLFFCGSFLLSWSLSAVPVLWNAPSGSHLEIHELASPRKGSFCTGGILSSGTNKIRQDIQLGEMSSPRVGQGASSGPRPLQQKTD